MTLETTRRLREGAQEDDLFGSLADTPEELWQQRYDDLMAVELQDDTKNDDLFDLIVEYPKIDAFEDRAKRTHRVEKSRMMSREPDDDGQYRIIASGELNSAFDAVMLHAALQARHQGKEGFTMFMLPAGNSYYSLATGYVRFVDRGENETPAELFIAADHVIGELYPVIPTRDEVKERQKERRRNR